MTHAVVSWRKIGEHPLPEHSVLLCNQYQIGIGCSLAGKLYIQWSESKFSSPITHWAKFPTNANILEELLE
jgi:hypothetical protein